MPKKQEQSEQVDKTEGSECQSPHQECQPASVGCNRPARRDLVQRSRRLRLQGGESARVELCRLRGGQGRVEVMVIFDPNEIRDVVISVVPNLDIAE